MIIDEIKLDTHPCMLNASDSNWPFPLLASVPRSFSSFYIVSVIESHVFVFGQSGLGCMCLELRCCIGFERKVGPLVMGVSSKSKTRLWSFGKERKGERDAVTMKSCWSAEFCVLWRLTEGSSSSAVDGLKPKRAVIESS
jgi:hypothetical protein